MTGGGEIAVIPALPAGRLSAAPVPASLSVFGDAGACVWNDFLSASIRNKHTRASYLHHVRSFLGWIELHHIELHSVSPGLIGSYLDQLPLSIPSKKVALAALRSLFNLLTTRHFRAINPALSARGERYSIHEGKTMAIPRDAARRLLESIDTSKPVGLRDKAILCTCLYTAARDGAIAALKIGDLKFDGVQYSLRFLEKGSKSREIPVRTTLQEALLGYLETFDWKDAVRGEPLFRSIAGGTGMLTANPIRSTDIYRMLKRRLHEAGLPTGYSPHGFRVSVITHLLTQGVPLEDVQRLAGHADPRTTRLYDRRQKTVTRNIVERISL